MSSAKSTDSSSRHSSRRNDGTTASVCSVTSGSTETISIPWIERQKENQAKDPSTVSNCSISIDVNVKPGQYVLQTLFAEFTLQAQAKIEKIMKDAQSDPLAKSLQRGEDEQFDQLLSSMSAVAEHCLPSLLKTLFDWYKMQNEEEGNSPQGSGKNKEEKDYVSERRDLAVDGVFCLVLIEVLKQLPRHPVPEEMQKNIEDLAFKHFKPREESAQLDPNRENYQFIADLYAEVLGVLAQVYFISVRRRFGSEMIVLRSEPHTEHTSKAIISLIMGMKFYRVKMYPVEDFELSFQLLHECANYYLEVKDKCIRYALAGLLVEILVPVAATVKNEVNIPVLKNFVDKLYQKTFEQCSKRKHALDTFPLITCLLCVSTKEFFLSKWYSFLEKWCFQELKNKNPVYSRVALESLYRLLWVYVIRIKCESNNQTFQKLSGIVTTLFPRNDRKVVPRDTHLNIFVKIIQFIAQEKLEYAIKDIIFDLMGVNNRNRVLCPERMNIGLRAFLVIADSLQQKEGAPPMPATTRIMPSGSTLRVRKTFLSKQLTDDAAKSIGVSLIYPSIKRALENIIRQLDNAVGKTLLMTYAQSKEVDDIMTNERKPKIELYRTCVVAIPRIIPDGMSRKELLELLCRLTVHRDEELRTLAGTSLQTIVVDHPEWRDDVLSCFTSFILKEVHDTFPLILESSMKLLLNFVQQWKNAVSSQEDSLQTNPPYERNPSAYTLNMVEGVALVFFCSCRPLVRRLSYSLLKEVRALFGILGYSRVDDDAVIDVLDRACPGIVESFINKLPPGEKTTIISLQTVDLHWVVERSISQWSSSTYEASTSDSLSKLASRGMGGFDPWTTCLARFFDSNCLPHFCPSAVNHAWPAVFTRLTQLNSQIDPNAPSEGRMAHIRGKKIMYPMDDNQVLWKTYLVFGCSCATPSAGYQTPSRCLSPEPSSGAPPVDTLQPPSQFSMGLERAQLLSTSVSAATLFKQLVPYLKCDNTDAREAAVNGLSWTNVFSLRDLIDELQPFIRDAIERKQENMRRKRRRDFLRVHLIRLFELLADHGLLRDCCSTTVTKDNISMHQTFKTYIDGMRQVLDAEGDKESPTLVEIRLHYSGFLHRLIRNLPVESRPNFLPNKVRHSAFQLCSVWCRTLGMTYGAVDRSITFTDEPPTITDLEMEAVQAMASLLVCGEVFDVHSLCYEGQIYSWLNKMLKYSGDERISKLGKETVKLLLENNSLLPEVLETAISKCYTESKPVADGYFLAIASVLANRDYPCDLIPTICVVLMKTGDPDANISSIALRLLQVLDRRFFPDNSADYCLGPTYGKSHTVLAQELARLHPEITMAMFNEITMRFESAPSTTKMMNQLEPSPTMSRKVLLEILLPWLYNIELVEVDIDNEAQSGIGQGRDDLPDEQDVGCPLRKPGWGSKQATHIVLNNLLSITQEYGDDYAVEMEAVWAGLCVCWSNNMRVILNYLLQFTSIILTPDLLPYLKRIVCYIARAKTNELMDLLMKEIQSVEVVNYQVERTEEPPYFYIFDQSSLPHGESVSSLNDAIEKENSTEVAHARAPSGDDTTFERRGSDVHQESAASSKGSDRGSKGESLAKTEGFTHHQSTSSLTTTLTSSSSTHSSEIVAIMDRAKPQLPILEEDEHSIRAEKHLAEDEIDLDRPDDIFLTWRQESKDGTVSIPLPLPEDIHCGTLSDLIENHDVPQGILHKCNLAVMLLTDLVMEQLNVNLGSHYLHIILHTVFLGMDHSWPLVYSHCKQLLLNLMMTLSPHGDHAAVAQMLLLNHSVSDVNILFEPTQQNSKVFNFTGAPTPNLMHPSESPVETTDTSPLGSAANLVTSSTLSLSSSGSVSTVVPSSGQGSSTYINGELRNDEEAAKALMEFLVSRKNRPLWSCEEITPRTLNIKSAEQISTFLQHVVRIFQVGHRGGYLEQRWAEIALQPALQGSSRHYAGRSFQIFRALNPMLTSDWLSHILRRLCETVTEQGNETQGYVTEILLTLENSIDVLAADLVFSEPRERSKTSSGRKSDFRKSTSSLYMMASGMYEALSSIRRPNPSMNITDVDSTSSTPPSLVTSASHADLRSYGDHRGRSASAVDIDKPRFHGSRSRSSQSLRNLSDTNLEEKLNRLAPLFWIFVSLLESDNEYEFYLALRSLDKLLKFLPLDRVEVKKKLEETLEKLDWRGYPGIQALVLKGFTSSVTIDLAQILVSKLTLHTSLCIVDPYRAAGFPLNVVALLPYLIQHFDQPDKMAIEITYSIARVCQGDRHSRIAQLADVLTMYREKTYTKTCRSWVGVVCKYLHEVYSQYSIAMMTFLIEVLEKGPSQHQGSVLQIIDKMLYNVDLMAAPMQQVNNNLLRIITKYVHGKFWSDSLEILKTAVKKTSTIVKPENLPSDMNRRRGLSIDAGLQRKELPGRTMEFTFDVWKAMDSDLPHSTPMISRRVVSMQTLSASMSDDSAQSTMSSDDSSMSTDPTETGDHQSATNNAGCQKIVPSGWRKPELSQSRTRERLSKVFNLLGPQNVEISRSPSILFSSTSIDKEPAPGSDESEESNTLESDTQGEAHVHSIFRFLYPDDPESADPFSDLYNHENGGPPDDDEDDNDNDMPVEDVNDPIQPEPQPVDVIVDQPRTPSDHSSPEDDSSSLVSTPSISLIPEHSSFVYIPLDEVECAWRKHADEVVKDHSEQEAVQTFHVFAHLYNVMQQRFCNLTREACNYLGDRMRGVAQEFLKTLELLSKYTVCPFVFVDTEVLTEGGLLQNHRCFVMELDDHYDTYITKRDSTHQCLDDIKSSLKRQSVASQAMSEALKHRQELIHINSQVELCRQLYKLYSQLRMLFDTYCKLVNSTRVTLAIQVTDFSQDVADAKKGLKQAAEDIERNMGSFSPDVDASQTTKEDGRKALRTEMGNRSFATALRMLHAYRSVWTGDMFGSGEEDDEDVLLHLFCEHLTEGKTGVRAISMTSEELAGICSRLMEVNMQLMTAKKGVELLEIQEVIEKHESEPCEGEEQNGMKHKQLKDSSENLEEENLPEDIPSENPPRNSLVLPNVAADAVSDAGSDSAGRRTPIMEIEGATLSYSVDDQCSPSPRIDQAIIVYTDAEEVDERDKEESSVASDDTVKAGSLSDEVDLELLASLKEESVDDPMPTDLPYHPTYNLSPLPEVPEDSPGLDAPGEIPVMEVEPEQDEEPKGEEGKGTSLDGEKEEEEEHEEEEEIWQRNTGAQETEEDLCTNL